MFKLKAERKRPDPHEGEIVTGMNALKLPIGTYLRVLPDSISNANDIIIRWDETNRPFRNVLPHKSNQDNGMRISSFWGTSLDGYRFRIIYGHIPEDFPEYQAIIEKENKMLQEL